MEIDSLSEFCRVCALRQSCLSSMFGKETNIVDKIFFCTGLRFTKQEGLPSNICIHCLNNLSIAYKFKTACLNSDTTFQNILPDEKVKEEEEIDKNDSEINDDFVYDDLGIKEEFPDVQDVKLRCVQEECEAKVLKGAKKDIKHNDSKIQKLETRGRPRTRIPKIYHCCYCGETFSIGKDFIRHKKEKHSDDTGFMCEICGKLCERRGSYYYHIRSHELPKYKCDLCAYRTSDKGSLIKHLRVHSGLRPFNCKHCSKSFRNSSSLNEHVKRSHSGKPPLRHHCPHCGKGFFAKSHLIQHIDTHGNVKRFECEVCHSRYSRRCYWKKHLKIEHNVIVPPQRPGRQKTNFMIGRELLNTD